MYIQYGGLISLKTKNDFERKNITFRLNYIYVLSFWKHTKKKTKPITFRLKYIYVFLFFVQGHWD